MLTLGASVLLALPVAQGAPPPAIGAMVAHLAPGAPAPEALAALRRAFTTANEGYDLSFHPRCEGLPRAAGPRIAFVQHGAGTAQIGEHRSTVEVGAMVLLRPDQRLSLAPAIDLLVFAVPLPLPAELPAVIRPDHDPAIADQPGGCATEASAYRRVALTWEGKNGPYRYRALNAHRVNVRDSFTHYHPQAGGFDEFYLVQGALPGARLLVADRLADILEPGSLDADEARRLLRAIPVRQGDLIYLPRGVVHRGLGGVLAQVITAPGFVPGAEIGVDRQLHELRQRLGLSADELPVHLPGLPFVSVRQPKDGERGGAGDGEGSGGSDGILVEVDGAPFTAYHWRDQVRPHFAPVLGPGGHPMTRAVPPVAEQGETTDHPHHQSLWFAHGAVDGADFWAGKGPRQVQGAPENLWSGPGSAGFTVATQWTGADGAVLLRDRRTFRFHATGRERTLDLDLVLTPTGSAPVRLGDTKEGTFALRLHDALRAEGPAEPGTLTDAEGRMGRAVWGQRSPWIHATGRIDGQPVGLAMFDHPENLRHPTWWHARTYGLLAANPLGVHDFEGKPKGTGDLVLEPGQQLRLRYRVLLYSGAPDEQRLQRSFEDFGRPAAARDRR